MEPHRRNIEPQPWRGFLLQIGAALVLGLSSGYVGVQVAISKLETHTTDELAYISRSIDENRNTLMQIQAAIAANQDLITSINTKQIFNMQRIDRLEEDRKK